MEKVIEDLIDIWCGAAMFQTPYERLRSYVVDIMNGEYPLQTAIEDVLSLKKDN
jgi:hypothetical protein